MALTAVAAAQSPPRVAVVELLRLLSASGVEVLYSSELVPPTLDAPDTTPQADPLSRVVAALGAHHLRLLRSGEHEYLVTREVTPPAAARPPAPPAPSRASVPPSGSAPHAAALDEVSVFSSRYEFTTTTTGEPTGFNRREFDQMPGAKSDSFRALYAMPGLASNLSARPYVRGALRDDVLVEFDGIALAEPFHFRNFQSVISIFNPSTVNRADVFTGGFPVNYGTRSGGVIDLAPRSVESGYEYGVDASLLSYDLETVGRDDDRSLEWLLVARQSSDDRVLRRLLSNEGEPNFYDLVGHVRWSPDATSALTLGWLMLDDQVTFDSNFSEEHAAGRSHDFTTWLRWDSAPAAAVQARSSLSATHTARTNRGTLSLPGLADASLNAERSFSSIGLRSDWTFAPGAVRWNFGGEFYREQADLLFLRQETLQAPIAAAFGRPQDATIRSKQSPRSSTFGAYLSANRRWQSLEAEIGVRIDAQDYEDFGVRTELTPRVNLRYDFTDRWHAYGSWGQFAEAQRVDEYRAEANQVTPDPAQRATHVVSGVAHESADSVTWRLEVYHDHWASISPYFDNALEPISILPQLEADRVLVVPADADAIGLEIRGQRAFSHGLGAWGSYSLSRVTDDTAGREVLRSWDQEHAVNVGVAWAGHHATASVLLAWHSGWPQTPLTLVPATAAAPAFLEVGARNSSRTGSYFSLDLRVSKSMPLAQGELSLWFAGTNVTNRPNTCCIDLRSMNPPTGVPAIESNVWSPRAVDVGFSFRVRRPQ